MRTVGKYTLGPLLGRGGTGEVYDARHSVLGHAVAVKVLRHELAFDDAMVSAFVGEAQRTREIAHPNVVRVFDFGRDAATNCCFLVMERLDGESLAARIAREGALPEHVLRPLGAALADGMQAAHDRNIVHRDLKPGNVMLRGDRLRGDVSPAIIDFGVAKSLGAGSAVVTSRRVGTLAYMAPEQLAQGLITPAVDIWALGAILYEAATGRPPFERFDEGRLPQLVETPTAPALLAPISTALSTLIMRCLEREPGRRPSTMAEIAKTLRGGNADERITQDAGPVGAALPRAIAAPMSASATLPVAHQKPLHRGWLAAYAAAAIGVGVAFGLTRGSASAPPAAKPDVIEAKSPAVPEPPPPEPVNEEVIEEAAIAIDPPPTPPDPPPPTTTNARPSKRVAKPTKPKSKTVTTKPVEKPAEKPPTTKPVTKPATKHGEGLD